MNGPRFSCGGLALNLPVDAMSPADEDVNPPQRHQDGVPVVVVAQERGDEEGEEDGDRAGEKEPREAHLSARDGA